jgi:CobQ-like glutamine amidotransferase family enzyme
VQETAPPYGTLNIEGLIQEKPSANIQAPPKPVTPVGTLPEAKPNIIMAGGGRDRTQTMVAQQEPLTDVPFIPSSNTDNFYVLYSQLNYNVVM